jgi:hypothetical protein
MAVPERIPHINLIEGYEKHYQVDAHFDGEIPADHGGDLRDAIWGKVAELINNCVENRIPGSDEGASNVWISFEVGKLTIKDDFEYDDPEAVLKAIIAIRDSGKPKTTRLDDEGKPGIGGMGIYSASRFFSEYGGWLNYYVENNTIVAEGTWDPALLQLDILEE